MGVLPSLVAKPCTLQASCRAKKAKSAACALAIHCAAAQSIEIATFLSGLQGSVLPAEPDFRGTSPCSSQFSEGAPPDPAAPVPAVCHPKDWTL